MSVKKQKHRRGGFVHESVSVKLDGKDAAESISATKDMLSAASPQGRVQKWKAHAERLGAGLEDLRAAESLIDGRGHVAEIDRFDLYLSRAVHAIDLAQMEEKIVPMAFDYHLHQSKIAARPRATGGMMPQEREERNRRIREHFDKAKSNLSLHGFATRYREKYNLSASQLKKILKSQVDT